MTNEMRINANMSDKHAIVELTASRRARWDMAERNLMSMAGKYCTRLNSAVQGLAAQGFGRLKADPLEPVD